MNKNELISAIAERTGLSKRDTKIMVKAFTEVVSEALVRGDIVQLLGFGRFKVTKRGERNGRNPQTGDKIKISGSKTISFKAGKALKNELNKG